MNTFLTMAFRVTDPIKSCNVTKTNKIYKAKVKGRTILSIEYDNNNKKNAISGR